MSRPYFYMREALWHGLRNRVEHALSSEAALQESGLGWRAVPFGKAEKKFSPLSLCYTEWIFDDRLIKD